MTRELRPVVDEPNGRLYAFSPRGNVVLLREYEDYRRRCARDAAITFWGDPTSWDAIDERVVSCECPDCSTAVRDWSSAWLITCRAQGIIKARIISVSDHGTEVVRDEHTIYTSPHLLTDDGYPSGDDPGSDQKSTRGARSIDVDTFSAMVERFGEPYHMATGEIGFSYRLLYRAS